MSEFLEDRIRRRRFLQYVGAAFVASAATPATAAGASVRVAANAGPENRALLHLMASQGFFTAVEAEQSVVLVKSPPACLAALVADRADIVIVSGFSGLLPAIAKGAPVKVVGAAQQKPSLAVYTARANLRTVADLAGHTVGVGPRAGLLHTLMLALLRAKGVDESKVRFVKIGSNAEVYRAVESGAVDAGPSDVSHAIEAKASGLSMLSDGKMWREIPDYPYQLAYASHRAIDANRDGLVRALAAYGRMFRFLSSRGSWTAYLDARQAAGDRDKADARAAWDYIQRVQPYAGSPAASKARLRYLQTLNVLLGLQPSPLPLDTLADFTLARDALRLM